MNKSNQVIRRILRLSFLLTILFSSFSCTYDYFVDETNFFIDVPQIRDGEIEDFSVVLYDMSGQVRFSRQYSKADIDGNPVLKEGVVKVRIMPGEYFVSCYSGSKHSFTFDPALSVELNDKSDNSYVSLYKSAIQPSYYSTAPNYDAVGAKLKRNFQTIEGGVKKIKAPFVGQKFERDGVTPVVDRVTVKVQPYCGVIRVKIKGLDPAEYSSVELITQGLSDRWRIDDTPALYALTDEVLASHATTPSAIKEINFSDQYFPSAQGTNLSAMLRVLKANGAYMSLAITEDDFRTMSQGNITRLNPRDTIDITIQNLAVISIDLKVWDPNINETDDDDGDM